MSYTDFGDKNYQNDGLEKGKESEKITKKFNDYKLKFSSKYSQIKGSLNQIEDNIINYNSEIKKLEGFLNEINQHDKKYKDIIDLINNILTPYFEKLCPEEETRNLNEIDTNSIEENERNLCPICLSDDNSNFVHINDCGHEIHLECLKQQLQSRSFNSKKCPLCRRRIKGIKEDPNFKVGDENQRENNLFGVYNNTLFNNNNNLVGNQNEENYYNNRRGLFRNVNNNSIFNNGGGLFGNYQNNVFY